MLEIMTVGEGDKGPIIDPPIIGFNFTTGSTSFPTETSVSPVSYRALPDGAIPPISGYTRVMSQSTRARLSNISEINIKIGTGDFTFEHWIAASGDNGWGFDLRAFGGSPVFVTARNSSKWKIWGLGFPNGVDMEKPAVVNTWHHVAFVRKDGRLMGFLNGVKTRLNSGSGYQDSLPLPQAISISDSSSGIHGPYWDFRWGEFAVSDFAKYEADFEPMHPLY